MSWELEIYGSLKIYSDITYIREHNSCLINTNVKTSNDEQKTIICANEIDVDIDCYIKNLLDNNHVKKYAIGETLINFINYIFPDRIRGGGLRFIPERTRYSKLYNDLLNMCIIFDIHYNLTYDKFKELDYFTEEEDNYIVLNHPYDEHFDMQNLKKIQSMFKDYIDIGINDISYFDYDFVNMTIEHDYFEKPYKIINNYINPNVEYNNDIDKIIYLKKEYEKKYKHRSITTYGCITISSFFTCELLELCKSGYIIKKCENCGKYFIPYNRSDTIYCDNASPQDNTRTCKAYGTQRLWYDKLKDNEAMKLCRNIHSAKQMMAKRRIDIPEYQKNFEEFKIQSKQWKSDVKSGKKTEEEFITWLYEVKNKRY